jgi:hypothetical protein
VIAEADEISFIFEGDMTIPTRTKCYSSNIEFATSDSKLFRTKHLKHECVQNIASNKEADSKKDKEQDITQAEAFQSGQWKDETRDLCGGQSPQKNPDG